MKKLLEILHEASGRYCYDIEAKKEYQKEAMHVLRKVAKLVGLQKGTYRVSFCKGGIAVWGEATLHTENVYLQIAAGSFGLTPIMVRRCEGLQDYVGGINFFVNISSLETRGYEALTEFFKEEE